MFHTSELKKYQLFDNGKMIGYVNFNPKINYQSYFTRPFIRNDKRMIQSIGRVNYDLLDHFIIASFKDYYEKINNNQNMEKRLKDTETYQELYKMWQKVAIAKQNNDFNLNDYYDDLVYRFYLLGYHN